MEERESKESVYDSYTNFICISEFKSVFNNNCFVNVYVVSKSRNKKDYGKFKSHFEVEVSDKLGKDNYEIDELEYEVPATPRKYIPDFTVTATDGHTVHFETKGRFRTKSEADKYIWVRDSNPDIDLRFIIMDKKTLMPRSKKTTMYDWLKKNGFTVYVWPNIPNIKKL